MRHLIRTFLLGSGLVIMAVGANAQIFGNGGGYRNDPYYGNDPYNRNDRYGRGYGDAGSLVARVQNDIYRAASNSYTDNHERKHFENASRNLAKFNDRMRQGKFDSHSLDKSIDDLNHLVNANQIRPRDRQMLANDMNALRQLRSSGGYNSGSYGGYQNRRYDPYGRNRY
jgi:hypothetical protein